MLHQTIKDNIKESMKSGDKLRLEVMRGIVTAFTNELLVKGKTPQEMLSDDEALTVISRLAKQRKDSIEQFTKGERMDLVEEEQSQLNILQEFLPRFMEKSEVQEFVKNKISEVGEIDITNKGLFMSTLMKDLKGKAEGSIVKE